MDTLVSTGWLADRLGEQDLVVLDCSVAFLPGSGFGATISGRAEYDEGHIPGAGFADLTAELCDADAPIPFEVPSPEQFCAALGALGVGDETRVVLYDSSLRAWRDEERGLSTDPVTATPGTLTPNVRPDLIADRDEVRAAIGDPAVRLVDTLPAEHFRGDFSMYARAGHIPGASNVSALDLVDESGRFLPDDRLAALHGDDPGGRTITYCGGGIAASSNAFVMARLGFEDVAVYTASLQEWAADPENPMVLGDS